MKKYLALISFLVAIVSSGCGSSTQVILTNDTTNNFGTMTVTGGDTTLTYTDLKKETSSSAKDWEDDTLTVTVTASSPASTDETEGVKITEGMINTITVVEGTSSSAHTYTNSAAEE